MIVQLMPHVVIAFDLAGCEPITLLWGVVIAPVEEVEVAVVAAAAVAVAVPPIAVAEVVVHYPMRPWTPVEILLSLTSNWLQKQTLVFVAAVPDLVRHVPSATTPSIDIVLSERRAC